MQKRTKWFASRLGEYMEDITQRRARTGRLRAFIIGSSALVLAATTSAVAVASSSSPRSLSGGGATYLTVSGVTGEGGTGIPTGGIEISSWSWGVSNSSATSTGGAGAGKITFNPFSITRKIDSASPIFFQMVASKTLIPAVQLTVSPPASSGVPGDTMTIRLSNVHIVQLQHSMSSGGDSPSESFSMNYSKIEMNYYAQGSAKAVHGGWDLAQNKKA